MEDSWIRAMQSTIRRRLVYPALLNLSINWSPLCKIAASPVQVPYIPEQENQLLAASRKLGKRHRKGEINQYRHKLQMEKMVLQPHMEGGSTSNKQ
jgi:hypothetical protein